MTSQVVFKMDTKLKERAMKKARRDGVPFSTVLKIATRDYVEGKLDLGIEVPKVFNAKTRREMKKALLEIREGKGLSPRFKTADEMIAYLDNL